MAKRKTTYRFAFFCALIGFAGLAPFLGVRTVNDDRRFDLLDSSSLSRSNFQKPPLPGSSLDRASFTKHLFRDKLCRMEFCNKDYSIIFKKNLKFTLVNHLFQAQQWSFCCFVF